jgi:acyl carrier protein
MDDITPRVRAIVHQLLAVDAPEDSIAPDTAIADLGADSLNRVEIAMSLEDAFGIMITDDQSRDIVTIADAARLVRTLREAA